jgi:hypothetical protein
MNKEVSDLASTKAQGDDIHGEPVVPSLGCLLQPIQRLAEKTDAHMLCRINKSSKLALVDSL